MQAAKAELTFTQQSDGEQMLIHTVQKFIILDKVI